jgi:hypothetical protein
MAMQNRADHLNEIGAVDCFYTSSRLPSDLFENAGIKID